MLVVVGRGSPGLPEHAERRMRHGAGRWCVAAHPASCRILVRAGLDGVADRPLPAVRRRVPTARFSAAASRSWCSSRCRMRSTTATAIHAVIRGSAINNDGSTKMTYAAPNRGRTGRRHRRGARRRRRRRHRRSAMSRPTAPARRWATPIEIEGLRQAFGVSERDPLRPLLRRLGQVEHRPPGVRLRYRQPDQGDSVPASTGRSPRRCTTPARTPNCTSTVDPSRFAANTARGNGTASCAPGSARSVSAAPTRTSCSKKRPPSRRLRLRCPVRRCC